MNKKITTEYDENGRICTHCRNYKIWDCYYKKPGSRTGFQSFCKTCTANTRIVNSARKKYTYSNKELLEVEKEYKSKENKIIGHMNRVKPIEKEIQKRTDRNDYSVQKPYWNNKDAVRSGENPVDFISLYIR